MLSRANTSKQRQVAATVHLAIAVLAAIGAVFIQTAWQADFDPFAKGSWRPNAALAIVLATGWLVWTAWVHATIARARDAGSGSRRQLIGRALVDVLVAAVALVIVLQGHRSQFASFGLWVIPPTLVAVSVLSSLAMTISATMISAAGP